MPPRSRRRFLRGSLGLGVLGLLSARGVGASQQQPARVPRVSVLMFVSEPGTVGGPFIAALNDGLHALGYGSDEIDVQVRSAQRPD